MDFYFYTLDVERALSVLPCLQMRRYGLAGQATAACGGRDSASCGCLWGRHGAGIECGFFGALATLETGGVKLLSSPVEVDIGRRHLDCFLGRFSLRRWVRTRWRTRDGWRYVGLPLSKHRRDGSVPVRDAQAGRQPFVGILFPRPGNNYEQALCFYGFRGDTWQREGQLGLQRLLPA
jgi:hypothetical protein